MVKSCSILQLLLFLPSIKDKHKNIKQNEQVKSTGFIS